MDLASSAPLANLQHIQQRLACKKPLEILTEEIGDPAVFPIARTR
jgi:hypothetical protein